MSPVQILVLDAAAAQPQQRILDRPVVLAALRPVGKFQHVGRVEDDPAGGCLTIVEAMHDLGDGVDQEILVVDGRQALHRRRDLQGIAIAVLVAADFQIRLLRQREEGVLHLLLDILQRDRADVDAEESRQVPDRMHGPEGLVGITGHARFYPVCVIHAIRVLGTPNRGIRHAQSGY